MIDDIIVGLIGGAAAEKLGGRWFRRHPYLTAIVCIPLLLVVGFLAARQLLGF
jgi:uncharacterized membrane protein YeaQ/YmgE (transglycosylase-associated protein family)